MTLSKKEIWGFVAIIALFLFLHFAGFHIPYHQDEYKWPQYADPTLTTPGVVPHPPLTEFLYRIIGSHIGYDNFRAIPFFFGFLNIFLIFYLAYLIFDKKTAFWTAGLFAVSYYSLLASLMVDVDGAVMPFFLLLLLIGYYKWKQKGYEFNTSSWLAFALILIGGIGGFLVKVICALPIFALALDYAIAKNMFSDKKKVVKVFGYTAVGVVALALVLVLSKLVFPFFHLEYALKYWEHFINFGSRAWLQIFIQVAKSILYCSPLLILPVFFADKEMWSKIRPLVIFVIFELITYLIVFDFSTGALDRYFQFLIVPLCLVTAAVYTRYLPSMKEMGAKLGRWYIWTISVVAVFIFSLQFLPQYVPALYPKSAWISRILSLHWSFLYVFSGGSGPFPFYVSFMFISLSWILCIGLLVWALSQPQFRTRALFGILILGLVYNAVFAEEYLFGLINGSGVKLLNPAVQFIQNDPAITKVVVYNDNGGYNVQETGKYARRLYADPDFEASYKDFFSTYSGYVLYIDIPKIQANSFYADYLATCTSVYLTSDKYIHAQVLDCTKK